MTLGDVVLVFVGLIAAAVGAVVGYLFGYANGGNR